MIDISVGGIEGVIRTYAKIEANVNTADNLSSCIQH